VPKHVKLIDVARVAGVSLGTASQALNQRSNVSAETREKVLEAALGLGYLKEPLKTLRAQELSVIGMLTKHDVNTPATVNPFYAHIQAGVEQACRTYGMSLMVSAIEVDRSNRPVALPAMIKEQHPDGLIFISTFLDHTIADIYRSLDTPIVLIDSYAPNLPYDSIITDNRQGALLAVNHLLEYGHEHIGLIGSHDKSPPSILERRGGYLEALQSHGLPPHIEDSDLVRQPAYTATKTLLEHSPEVTAIFACNDDVAAGVMQAVREMGKRVPDDISVVGFDNIASSADLYPPLTTIHIHKTWMGLLGVQTLIERARNPDKPKTTLTLATDLVIRQSVARAKSKARASKGGQTTGVTATVNVAQQ
jgi:DNA-binding LacI/PurR family transcriptional regulator